MHYNFKSNMKFLEDVLVHVFIISVTGMPFLFFSITFCSRFGMEWDTVCKPTEHPFLAPGVHEPVHLTPKQY